MGTDKVGEFRVLVGSLHVLLDAWPALEQEMSTGVVGGGMAVQVESGEGRSDCGLGLWKLNHAVGELHRQAAYLFFWAYKGPFKHSNKRI